MISRITLSLLVIYGLAACAGPGPPTEPDGGGGAGPPPGPPAPPTLSRITPAGSTVTGVPGQAVTFEVEAESPDGLPLTITFRLNGLVVATGTRFQFTPAVPGSFEVEVVASDGERSVAHTWTLSVGPRPNLAPTAALTVDPTNGTAPLAVRIRVDGVDADGTITTYRVSLTGPETVAIESAVPIDTVLMLAEGLWTVAAVVVDDAAAEGSAAAVVQVDPPPNQPPTALLTVDPVEGPAPLSVTITGDGADIDGTIAEYALDINGDGVFDIMASVPLAQSVRFQQPGEFWVRLRVTDDRGAAAQDSVLVRVTDPSTQPPPPPPGGNVAPTNDLTVTPLTGPAPLAVTAQVVGADTDGVVTSVTIDFDDDGNPEAATVQATLDAAHTYDTPGTFTVRSVVTDDNGATTETTTTVIVTDPGVPPPPPGNNPPTGTLAASSTSGDAPASVTLTADGGDDRGIVRWEIDDDQGAGFVDVDSFARVTISYPFRATPYGPRLRLTDTDGATTIVDGPAITVFRPISAAGSAATVTGNARFDGLTIAPAIWADGQDEFDVAITVRDHAGQPLPDVPVRVNSLRPHLIAGDGTDLGQTVSISLVGSRTDAAGQIRATVTTDVSSRAFAAPAVGVFIPFDLEIEANAGHGNWRALPLLTGLNAESVVNNSASSGTFFVTPQGRVCVGQTLEFEIRATRRSDAPSPGQPAAGVFAEIRFAFEGSPLAASPVPGFDNWRMDGSGTIRFRFASDVPDFRALTAWVDGQPLTITVALAIGNCP